MAASQAYYRWSSSTPRPATTGRLMEKPGHATSHRNHEQTAWGEKPGGGGQHTQYIRRLADLRDELLNQEETALARALDRLRLHSINNRDAARYRLKIKDEQTGRMGVAGTNGLSGPRPMMTTVEKFRQMRPQRRQPVIFPLQGKQIIETSPTALNGHRHNGEETVRSEPTSLRVEETVRANLQRLIQPTSSIPNIGRKALKQESLELKPQPLQNMRNRVYKSTRHHLASPFMTQVDDQEEDSSSRPGSSGELHLSPHAYKLGPMTDGDRINMDKLNQYYYICCLPSTPSSRETDRRSLSLSTPKQSHRRVGKLAGRPRRVRSERSNINRAYNDSSRVGMVVSSEAYSDSESHVHTRYRYSVDAGSERPGLPVIKSKRNSPAHDTHRSNGVDIYLPQHVHSPTPPDTPPDEDQQRRQIVIDMPHIIFNAATPDISQEDRANNLGPTSGPGTLSKTVKQNEIRHRELQNLLEDVKELNMRTETLNTQCPAEAPSGVC